MNEFIKALVNSQTISSIESSLSDIRDYERNRITFEMIFAAILPTVCSTLGWHYIDHANIKTFGVSGVIPAMRHDYVRGIIISNTGAHMSKSTTYIAVHYTDNTVKELTWDILNQKPEEMYLALIKLLQH